MIIKQNDLKKTGAEEAEVDGFINFGLSIAGVKITLLFFELKDGVKISLRSKGNISVNKLAKKFGGGGHYNAAGIRLFSTKLKDILPKVISEAEKLV